MYGDNLSVDLDIRQYPPFLPAGKTKPMQYIIFLTISEFYWKNDHQAAIFYRIEMKPVNMLFLINIIMHHWGR